MLRCFQAACSCRLAPLHDACMVPVSPADGFACHVNPMPAAVNAVSAMDASLFARYSSCVHYPHNSPHLRLFVVRAVRVTLSAFACLGGCEVPVGFVLCVACKQLLQSCHAVYCTLPLSCVYHYVVCYWA